MKIRLKLAMALGVVVLVCSWAASVWAGQEIREERSKGLREVLGLTEQQVQAIRHEQQAMEVRTGDLHVQVQVFEEQIYHAAENTGDPTAVGKLVLQKIAVQKQIRAEQEGFESRISAILTPEQQTKLAELSETAHLVGVRSPLFQLLEPQERREAVRRGGGAPGGRREPRERAPEK